MSPWGLWWEPGRRDAPTTVVRVPDSHPQLCKVQLAGGAAAWDSAMPGVPQLTLETWQLCVFKAAALTRPC